MTSDNDTVDIRFDNIDRILLGVCAVLWLGALGAAVAATVALVDLGLGRPAPAGDPGTPWLLYSVIAVSALVIIVAVPLLLRARRSAVVDDQPAVDVPDGPRRTEVPTEEQPADAAAAEPAVRRAGSPEPRVDPDRAILAGAIDRLWLRCGLGIAAAIGAATLLIAAATYLMAAEMSGVAWGCYGVAAVITVAMPVIPWWILRELHELVGDRDS